MNKIQNAFTGKSEQIKEELYFDINGFNVPKTDDDLYSLAKKIENLLILKPGTYPNSPRMGIYIEKYAFEQITNENLQKITDEINKQVNDYIGKEFISNIQVSVKEDEHRKLKYLFIFTQLNKVARDITSREGLINTILAELNKKQILSRIRIV